MLVPVRTAAPGLRVVTFDDMDLQARLDGETAEQALIEAMIDSATDILEGHAGILRGRAFIDQTWQQAFPVFSECMRLPIAPASSITSVTYFDGDNASQTLSTDIYRLLTDERGPYVARKPDQSWPGTYSREDAVTVTFVAGYGAAAANVPAPIREAIRLIVAHRIENREAAVEAAMQKLPLGAEWLLDPYRRLGV